MELVEIYKFLTPDSPTKKRKRETLVLEDCQTAAKTFLRYELFFFLFFQNIFFNKRNGSDHRV